MKKALFLSAAVMVALLGFSTSAEACIFSASIAGPSGRCAAPAGVPTTYTGTHNFSSSGCTIYEWTISGGTLTGPGGVSVTNGTLCITENLVCFSVLGECNAAAIDVNVASGNGASVSVIWAPGVVGTLDLNVLEIGTTTLSAQARRIVNDISLPAPSSTSLVDNGNGTSTFTANFNTEPCPGTVVNWTVNGNPAGTGNPRTLSVTSCSNATVCAFTSQTVGGVTVTSASTCRTFSGACNGEMVGPETATINSFLNYAVWCNLSSISTIEWSISPLNGVWITNGTNNPYFDIVITDPGVYYICAIGTTTCNQVFEYCLATNVTIGGGGFIKTQDNGASAEDMNISKQQLASSDSHADDNSLKKLSAYPTLLENGQILSVQIPGLEQPAHLQITNLQGQVVNRQMIGESNTSIDLPNLVPGVYILSATVGNWFESIRFVVK
jgi:hypothetical protein